LRAEFSKIAIASAVRRHIFEYNTIIGHPNDVASI
jgi:hypothetical protein